ncbi:hypothetical protein BDB01DRAFT_715855 [Pilobolus umbonatus]|nr:hypothetical protein BDB01DRAFT_715855 [Pilobolus umbonatus]
MDSPTKILILGGGAAGTLIAMKLACNLTRLKLDITLTFFEYTPALCSVLYEQRDEDFYKHFKSITYDYKELLTGLNMKFTLGNIEDIKDKQVYLSGNEVLDYDIAIICTGSSYADPWKTQLPKDQDNPSSVSTVDLNSRLEYLTRQREEYKAANNILCIGGGPVGVEVAAEITYRSPNKQVTLVDANPSVLSSAPADLGVAAQKILSRRPCLKLIMEEKASLKHKDDNRSIYETDKTHTEITADLVYNCIGVTPNSHFLEKSHSEWLNDKKQVKVDKYLRVEGETDVFAIGDINSLSEPKMFFTAHMQALHFTRNIERIIQNLKGKMKRLDPYEGSNLAMVISLGPSRGVGYMARFKLTGWPFETSKGSRAAAYTKYLIERIAMNDFHAKVPFNNLLYLTHSKDKILARLLTSG